MKLFACPHCGNRIYFENGRCLSCGNDLLYDAPAERFVLKAGGGRFPCANADECGCNWAAGTEGAFCPACRLDRFLCRWTSLREAANALNRCMGLPDLYPFVISPVIVEKLRFVHELLHRARGARPAPRTA